MLKTLFTFVAVIFLWSGCSSVKPVQPQGYKEKQNLSKDLKVEAEKAKQYAKWYVDQEQKVPLTIIALAYSNPKIKTTKEYKRYKKFIALLKKDPSKLKLLVSEDILEKFSPINIVDFDEDHQNLLKYSAVYKNRLSSKEVLNDILRFDDQKPQAEIMLSIDLSRLENGEFVLQGYKTIKTTDKEQNSDYFTLVKKNYAKLSDRMQKELIIQSFATALKLSIQDYVIVDREQLYNEGKKLRILKKIGDTKYKASILATDKRSRWEKIEQKQKMFISPLLEEDIQTLFKNHYITFATDTLTTKQIEELAEVLDRSFFDPVLVASYPTVIADISGSDIEYKKDTLIINVEDQYDLEDILMASSIDMKQAGFKMIYKNSNFIENDIDTEFAFAVLDYMQEFDDPSSAPFNNLYIEFKDGVVYKIVTHKVDADELIKKEGIDTLLYKNRKFSYLYNDKSDFHFKFLLFFGAGEDYCRSSMFRPDFLSNLIYLPILYYSTVGLIVGSYGCSYIPSRKESLVEDAGFRDLEIFRSEL